MNRVIGLAAVIAAAGLGVAASPASGAFTARVKADTLKITGDAASDKLVLRLQAGNANILQLDVGDDGTADFSFDRSRFTAVEVDAGAGDDVLRIDQSGGAITGEDITLNGGADNDVVLGGSGTETLIGGMGNDFVDGNQGADRAFLGGGNDHFQWDPGDGSDTVEGQGGRDALDFNGANIAEQIAVSANGARVRFTRDIANIAMDLNGVEDVDFIARGGADNVVVGDLRGTEVATVDVDISTADAQPDSVTANGTDAADSFEIVNSGGLLAVGGLGVLTRVVGGEETLDNLNVALLGGDDAVSTAVGVAGQVPVNVDGGTGDDTATYSGTSSDDTIDVVANGTEVATVAAATARLDTTLEHLVVRGLEGADTITGTGNLAALTALTLEGGEGADTLRGGNGADVLQGGAGDDLVDGNQGSDQAFLGGGSDRFQWDPGDGSDVVEGQDGNDALDFNGSNIGEEIAISSNGPRVRFTRNIASIVMDLAGIEDVNFRALGGADTITVDPLSGTGVESVDVDLGMDDALADTVVARGTGDADHASIVNSGGLLAVSGLGALTRVVGGEETLDNLVVQTLEGDDAVSMAVGVSGQVPVNVDGGPGNDSATFDGASGDDEISVVANGTEVSTVVAGTARLDTVVESLVVRGLDGADTISAVGNLAALTALTFEGGEGADTLRGGNGADVLAGGPGGDFVDGNQGNDRAFLGGGDDRFQWDPGDGSDLVEGQDGNDALDFNGSNIGEEIAVSANGPRVRFTRNIGSIVMDLAGIEAVNFRALSGADKIVVGDLSGTDVAAVELDLNAVGAIGDGQSDAVTVTGSDQRDVVSVVRSGGEVSVAGLAATTHIAGSEPTLDTLLVQTLDGDDDVTVAPDVGDLIAPTVDLGPGE